ncbi:hypothetical protein L218DRAFT_1076360 [Marasmius fiardii PR-910]|nr:hypothetical protein L218DRAFT_1076360 [Marasmius fiardii PR-910]
MHSHEQAQVQAAPASELEKPCEERSESPALTAVNSNASSTSYIASNNKKKAVVRDDLPPRSYSDRVLKSFFKSSRALFTRRSVARILSTFILSIIIVIRPVSKYGGVDTAFVALTIKELVFSPQETLAQQFEFFILHLVGGMVAIAISILAMFLSSLCPPDSNGARAIPSVFLALTSFSGAAWRSSLPRLTLASRFASLVHIWLLTTNAGLPDNYLLRARNFVWLISIGAGSSLVACFLVLRWSSAQLAHDVAESLHSLHQSLQAHLDPHSDPDVVTRFHQKLLKQTVALGVSYHQASFEVRIGRIAVKTIKPLIGTVEHLRRGISWGTAIPKLYADPSHGFDFPDLVLNLGNAVLHSLHVIRLVVLKCYDVPCPHSGRPVNVPDDALTEAHDRLTSALKRAEAELDAFGKEFGIPDSKTSDGGGMADLPASLCLVATSLLQMAHECMHALKLARKISDHHAQSRPKLWYPHFTSAWLGAAPNAILLEERGPPPEDNHNQKLYLSIEEAKEGMLERDDLHDEKGRHFFILPALKGRKLSLTWFRSLFAYLWRHPKTMALRLKLSRTVDILGHSNHLKYAFKSAVGVSLLSLPAFLPSNSSARHWWQDWHGQWMVISFILVIDTNQGSTWRVGYLRFSGTILGALYAYITVLISRHNPYGIVALVTLAEVPMSWIVTQSTFPSMGTVANITGFPIIFTGYFSQNATSAIELAGLSALMILLGILAALVLNSAVYPRMCRVMFLQSACQAVGLLTQLYTSISRDLFQHTGHSDMIERKRRLGIEWNIRQTLHRMSVLVATMNDELSLAPKPMRRYREVMATLHRLLDYLIGLRTVREHIPRKQTVTAVACERRELVSCVCVSLFACEQVFLARQPLPQFLPSSRQALMKLHDRVGPRIKNVRGEHRHHPGLAVVYTLAEASLSADVVATVEELLDSCRQLFGTTSWLDEHPGLDLTTMISSHEEVGTLLTERAQEKAHHEHYERHEHHREQHQEHH